ncbi:hypothetical protein FE392_19675 [Xenorhabdus sp. 12]|uniref:Uncharacterized protein n=1 Tax=Xenorhabdus santafensis TaxID=2582833 RepID=A0ABU4SFA6_9GAMM|nr:hypothetical protein [Xenorhabdus sp. 12]MDX7989474.1 hypothetical protein [Xenorhabdus sp. 12]
MSQTQQLVFEALEPYIRPYLRNLPNRVISLEITGFRESHGSILNLILSRFGSTPFHNYSDKTLWGLINRLGFFADRRGGFPKQREAVDCYKLYQHNFPITLVSYKTDILPKITSDRRNFSNVVREIEIRNQQNQHPVLHRTHDLAQQPSVHQQIQDAQEQMRREIRESGWQNGFRSTTPLRPFFSPSRSPTPPSTPWTDVSGNEWTNYEDDAHPWNTPKR